MTLFKVIKATVKVKCLKLVIYNSNFGSSHWIIFKLV
jgi:hypothetical protein